MQDYGFDRCPHCRRRLVIPAGLEGILREPGEPIQVEGVSTPEFVAPLAPGLVRHLCWCRHVSGHLDFSEIPDRCTTWAPTAIRGPVDAANRRAIIGWREDWTFVLSVRAICWLRMSMRSVPLISAWVCDRSGQLGEWRCPLCRDGSPEVVEERHDLEPFSCHVAVFFRWVPPLTVVRN